MAKQAELKNLLQELEIATRYREHCNTYSTGPDENALAFHAADKAEKRVFSLFDKVSAELQDSAAAYKNLQEQRNYLAKERDEARNAAVHWQKAAQAAKADLQELAQQVMAMKPTDTVAPAAPEPFNETKALAGWPIEICMAPDHWIEKKFVGMIDTVARGRQVAYEHNEALDWAPVASARMKPKAPQQLQMFANLYGRQGSSGQVGALYDTKEDADRMGSVTLLAVGVPVTITVVK